MIEEILMWITAITNVVIFIILIVLIPAIIGVVKLYRGMGRDYADWFKIHQFESKVLKKESKKLKTQFKGIAETLDLVDTGDVDKAVMNYITKARDDTNILMEESMKRFNKLINLLEFSQSNIEFLEKELERVANMSANERSVWSLGRTLAKRRGKSLKLQDKGGVNENTKHQK